MKHITLKIIFSLVILFDFFPSFAGQRIISLAPNITEILFSIGAGKDIVGTSVYSDYPEAAKKIPIVANAGQLNVEAIIAAKPTMIVAWKGGNPQTQLDELKKFNIPIYLFRFNHISDITNAMQQLGRLTDHQSQAAKKIELFNKKLKDLQHEKNNSKPIKVFYLLWQSPLITIGNHTLINQAITFCGGKNIFSDIAISAPTVSIASILQRDPKIIIAGFAAKNWQSYWLQWPQISAVKTKQLFYLDPNLLQRPGPRFILGMEHLCGIISSLH